MDPDNPFPLTKIPVSAHDSDTCNSADQSLLFCVCVLCVIVYSLKDSLLDNLMSI